MYDDELADDPTYDSLPDDDSFAEADDALGMARIEEFQEQSLREEDPLAALLGRITGGMAQILLHQERSLKAAISRGDDFLAKPEERFQLNSYLALARQIERNTNLGTRLAESRSERTSASRRRRTLR